MKRGFAYILLCIFIAITAILVLAGYSDAQEMEPRAWLPLLTKNFTPPSVSVVTNQAVVETGTHAYVELKILNAYNITKWESRLVWTRPGLELFKVFYEDGLWYDYIRWDKIPIEGWNYVDIGQSSGLSSSEQEAHVATLDLKVKEAGQFIVCAPLTLNGIKLRRLDCQNFEAMHCVFDYNNDGIRDLSDITEVQQHIGCKLGDSGYQLKYDANGNGIVEGDDAMIVATYWNIPCPDS